MGEAELRSAARVEELSDSCSDEGEHRLEQRRAEALLGGGAVRIGKQHDKGKRTARERLEALLDPGSFAEIGTFVTHRATGFDMESQHPLGDGVVTGTGEVEGRPVCVFAQDFTVLGGSVGEAHGRKIARIMEMAVRMGVPLIGLNDSGGARIQEGVDALAAYGEIFYQNVQASGVIPQISVILGPCAGGAVYSPAITDFVVMVDETAHMFVTGPQVVRAVTHEDVDFETLGGAGIHSEVSGVAHFVGKDETMALDQVRELLSYLPQNNLDAPPYLAPHSLSAGEQPAPTLEGIVPEDPQYPYDVRLIIEALVDEGEFMEVHAGFARNLVVAFARMDGHPVGIVANQPEVLAGVLDIDASDKGARFVRFCDAFHIPLVTLVDTPGFLPGVEQEHGGVIRHGAKLLYAYAEATVPKVALILRKAYGGAYIVMSSKHLRNDVNFAWPNAEIAVMGPEGAVAIVFRKELAQGAPEQSSARLAELTEHYRSELANPYIAASRGYVDDVIKPDESRKRLIQALDVLREKREATPRRKHGNIPL